MNKPTQQILVLGGEGMLGSLVSRYLKGNPALNVHVTNRTASPGTRLTLDALAFARDPDQYADAFAPYDYVINCIGIIKPYCRDDDPVGCRTALWVNAVFPHELAQAVSSTQTKVIQIATDCVFSGKEGFYLEHAPQDPTDVYGKSKSLGEVDHPNFLHLRCSIIGPEIKGRLSLLEWFLAQPEDQELTGYEHHLWNGVTTLQYAKLCEQIISTEGAFTRLRKTSAVHHFVPNEAVSKYQLLKMFAETYGRKNKIKRVHSAPPIYRTLGTRFPLLSEMVPTSNMRTALQEMKAFGVGSVG